MGERETWACGQCQVRQIKRHDTWMTVVFRDTKMCNPELGSSWATRVRVMKWDHAVQLCTCCICGWQFTPLCRSSVWAETRGVWQTALLGRVDAVVLFQPAFGAFLASDQPISLASMLLPWSRYPGSPIFVALLCASYQIFVLQEHVPSLLCVARGNKFFEFFPHLVFLLPLLVLKNFQQFFLPLMLLP